MAGLVSKRLLCRQLSQQNSKNFGDYSKITMWRLTREFQLEFFLWPRLCYWEKPRYR